MDTFKKICELYNIIDFKSPIKLMRSRWGSLSKLPAELGFKVGVEVGVEKGRFSKALCEMSPQMKLYSVDIWEGTESLYLDSRKRLMPFENNQIIRDWSVEAAKRFADSSIDFIFIDAEHDYKNIKADLEAWIPKVRSGGVVSGHDYVNGMHGRIFGVRQAISEWMNNHKIDTLFLLKKGSNTTNVPSWFFVKL